LGHWGPDFEGEEKWKKFLFNGFLQILQRRHQAKFLGQTSKLNSIAPTANNLEVIFYRDSKVDDGRYANNGWMQELPDPVTKITWDNAVLVSRKTARELGVANGDVVEISLNGKTSFRPDLDAAGHGGLFARPRARLRTRAGRARRHGRRFQCV
jgi:hypothetical protein